MPFFDALHRFLPALFRANGWGVAEVDMVDRPGARAVVHYGIINRLAVGIPDLFGVSWLTRRRSRSPSEGKARHDDVGSTFWLAVGFVG